MTQNDTEQTADQALDIHNRLTHAPRIGRWFAVVAGLAAVITLMAWVRADTTSAPTYKTQTVELGSLMVTVAATGNLEPINQVDVGSELSGIIATVEVDYNDRVKQGEPLARLDVDRLEALVLETRSALESARAKVVSAEATLAERSLALDRAIELVTQELSPQSSRDEAEAAFKRAEGDLAQAKAQVSQAEATLNTRQTDLGKAIVRSPINGIVLDRNIEPGQTVAASLQAPVLFTLAEDLTQMELHVAIDEADVGTVREGQAATFTVDAFPDRSFPATITQLRYASETVDGVVTYEALLRVDNSELLLRPGMTATAEIVVETVEGAVLVPNQALRFEPPTVEERSSNSGGSILSAILPRRGGPPEKRPASKQSGGERVWTLTDGQLVAVPLSTGVTDGRMSQSRGWRAPVRDGARGRCHIRRKAMSSAAQNGKPVIELETVTKVYGRDQAAMHALRGIGLRIHQGEFIAVMGPSGSGKSTCMNILGCLDTPTSGRYLFKGVDVGKLSRDQRALLRRHYLGFVFQGFNLLNRTTALENVELPLIYRGTAKRKRRELSLAALDAVGLKRWQNHSPNELSGGQQQRVAIARAIVTEPSVLLADEPTGNLDTSHSREIMDSLTSFNRELGITVVMVTHEQDMAAYANRVIHFVDGLVMPGSRAGRAA